MIYASNSGNLQIESTNFAGGRINLTESGSSVNGTNGASTSNTGSILPQNIHYFHTDHLGSIRAITDQNGEVIEQNAYYPFGSRHTFGNTYDQTTNRFKFNGKEEQTTGNLQYLDYGARMYDANIGRWMVQDPLAEKYYAYSQYSFSGNNPILNIDTDGKAWDTFIVAAFLIYDLGSALYNHIIGEHSRAKQNWKDVGIDAASIIIPGVAAPMMKGVGKVANKLDNATDAGKVVDKTEDISSGTAKAVGSTDQYSVYTGMDADGNVKYVGITGRDPEVRFKEHKKSKTERAGLEFYPIENLQGLTKEQARIQEQLLINQHGLGKDGGVLLNKINSISPNKWSQYNIK